MFDIMLTLNQAPAPSKDVKFYPVWRRRRFVSRNALLNPLFFPQRESIHNAAWPPRPPSTPVRLGGPPKRGPMRPTTGSWTAHERKLWK